MSKGMGSREEGASTVEFAIVLTVLLLILFGTIQFGIAYNRKQGLQAAAHEGARLASTGASMDEVSSTIRSAQSLFNSSDVSVVADPEGDPPCKRPGDVVTIRAEVAPTDEYAVTIPLFGTYPIHYTATAQFRCERNGLSK